MMLKSSERKTRRRENQKKGKGSLSHSLSFLSFLSLSVWPSLFEAFPGRLHVLHCERAVTAMPALVLHVAVPRLLGVFTASFAGGGGGQGLFKKSLSVRSFPKSMKKTVEARSFFLSSPSVGSFRSEASLALSLRQAVGCLDGRNHCLPQSLCLFFLRLCLFFHPSAKSFPLGFFCTSRANLCHHGLLFYLLSVLKRSRARVSFVVSKSGPGFLLDVKCFFPSVLLPELFPSKKEPNRPQSLAKTLWTTRSLAEKRWVARVRCAVLLLFNHTRAGKTEREGARKRERRKCSG